MSDLMDCYIIDILNDDVIKFKLLPDEVSDTVSTSWDTTDVRGRTAPFLGYSGNSARTVSFSVVLHEDYCYDSLFVTVNKLKALCYPSIKSSIITPPSCYVRFGNMVKMNAIIESVSVSWQKPSLGDHKYFSQAEVSLEFTQYCKSDADLPTHSSMLSNGGNIGI